MIVHFSLLLYAATTLVSSAQPLRRLSAETEALLNSRLIFVYDDGECRELEGLQEYPYPFGGPDDMPYHRMRALGELERRISEQWKERVEHEDRTRSLEQLSDPPAVHTVYLEALQMEIAKVPDGMSIQDLEQAARDLPCVKFVSRDDVKYAEPMEVIEGDQVIMPLVKDTPDATSVSGKPSDPLWRYQWGLQKGAEDSYGIDAEAVWNDWNWQGSDDMIIAIIDSGCNLHHPDMNGQFWRNSGETDCNDGIDNDGNGFIDDCWGWDFVEEDNEPQAKGTSHGTAAAGIIAARSNNSEGVAGICWNCKLMCLRFISNTEGTVANEVRAIDYAVRMGAKISNNSYGGYAHQGSRVEQEAIERANKKGHLFVTSAGNNNIGTDSSEYIHTPSGYPVDNVLAVGASTETGRKTSFSNWGAQTVHMFAPGRNVISTGRDGYLINQGTSFAAPHVAGIAGLIWSRYPILTSDDVVRVLMQSCRAAADLKGLARCGGVINAELAMRRAEAAANEKEGLTMQVNRQKGYTPNDAVGSSPLQDALRKLPSLLRPVVSALSRMAPLGPALSSDADVSARSAFEQGLLPPSRRRSILTAPVNPAPGILASNLPPLPQLPFSLPKWEDLWNPFASPNPSTPTLSPSPLKKSSDTARDRQTMDGHPLYYRDVVEDSHPEQYDWSLVFDCDDTYVPPRCTYRGEEKTYGLRAHSRARLASQDS